MSLRPRVAIVGAGIAGLTLAWLLRDRYRVTVFERAREIGGNVRTVDVRLPSGRHAPVEMGVQCFHSALYPNLMALLRALRVPVVPRSMSFAFSLGSPFLWSSLHRDTLAFKLMARDAQRFCASLEREPGPTSDITVSDWCAREQVGWLFQRLFIFPILHSLLASLSTPIRLLLPALRRGGIGALRPEGWCFPVHGGQHYMKKLAAEGGATIQLLHRVVSITPSTVRSEGPTITHEADRGRARVAERFEHVVCATPRPATLEMLGGKLAEFAFQRALGNCVYRPIRCHVHSDRSFLPPQVREPHMVYSGYRWAVTYNQFEFAHDIPGLPLVTYQSRLRRLAVPCDVVSTVDFSVPNIDVAWTASARCLSPLNGQRGVWFCGASMLFDAHEYAVRSALVIAEALGVPFPFAEDAEALAGFREARDIMAPQPLSPR